ncbi:MAG: glutamate-1-semialdehyde 2,1-aminomutase [Actinomycetota bacterium]
MTAPKSHRLFESASTLMPGGVSSPVRAFGAVGGTPVFIASGNGAYVTDVDGKTYVDMMGSWGPLILGHANNEVVSAIGSAAKLGTSFGAPTAVEVDLARCIVDAVPSVEMVRFVSSGTEATMSALRLARAATGRSKILKFAGCYHGHVDPLLVAAGSGVLTLGLPDSPGVTDGARSDTLVGAFNNISSAQKAFDDFGDQLAAVIVEPIAANMGVVPPTSGFLEELRALCNANGSLLIFDEVVTGFRVGWQGAQGMYRVTPDLTILGKIIGGGLPVGAYGGRKDLMQMIAPKGSVYQAGTLSGNPLSMAAGLATLRQLSLDPPYGPLDAQGAILEAGLSQAAKQTSTPLTVQRVGSMFTAYFTDQNVGNFDDTKSCNTQAFAAFFHAMLHEGVYWPPSQFESAFISTAHGEQDIELVISAARRAFERI